MSFSVFPGAVIDPSNGVNNGSIGRTIVSGGVPPYKFTWSDVTFIADGLPKVNLAPAVYTLAVTDSATNTFTSSFTLVMNTVPLTLLPGSVTGSLESNSGSITQSHVYGGVTPYAFQWDYQPVDDDLMAKFDLAAGPYTVTVTDSVATKISHTFIVPQLYLSLLINPGAVTPATATGGGSIALSTVTGGQSPYTVEWDYATSADLAKKSNLQVGTYTVTVSSTDNQVASQHFIVPHQITIAFGAINADKNVIAATTITGGVAPLMYDWYRKNYMESQYTTADSRPITRDVYTLVVTDSTGQQVSNTIKNI